MKFSFAMGVAFALFVQTAQAQPAEVAIELNKLEPRTDSCRAYLVLQNVTDGRFDSLKLDLVMFDSDGIIANRLAVETAPLPAGKTSLKAFDIGGLACEAIGRILVNDVLACEGAAVDAEGCLPLLSLSARGDVPFIQ